MFDNNIFKKMTIHAKHGLQEANDVANFCSSKVIKPEHLLFAIFLEKGSLGSNILRGSGIKQSVFDKTIFNNKNSGGKKNAGILGFSDELKKIIVRAYSLASKFNYPYVGTEHLVFSTMEKPNPTVQKILQLADEFKTKNSKPEKIDFSGKKQISKNTPVSNVKIAGLDKSFLNGLFKALNIKDLSFPFTDETDDADETPSLDYFCTNLNKQAEQNDHKIIGREKEIEQIAGALGRKNKNNPLLIGDPGVGKTALVEGLAKKINTNQVPQHLLNKKILSLDMALVVAGTTFRGEFEQRLKDIIDEVSAHPNIILFIDEIHSIVGAGNVTGGLDAANILKPALTQGEIQCIGATTLDEFKKHIEKDSALERRFQPIIIGEPSSEETVKILSGIKKSYEKFHNVIIADEAIEQAVSFGNRYIQDRFQPDKSIDLIDETSARIRSCCSTSTMLKKINANEKLLEELEEKKSHLVSGEKYDEALALRLQEDKLLIATEKLKRAQRKFEKENPIIITAEDIAETISRKTKIPLAKLLSQTSSKITHIARRLNSQIIGQSGAIEKLSATILRSQTGVSNENKPIGSFLFLGPSGVGKTLTARTLAKEFFGDDQALIKIDMSEFMERHSISQLLGAPAGYVGYGEGGKLTEQVRRQPYSLILFDEIEKAHPDVFNLLLQILEDGILTDAEGRKINFKNTIIILTSNIGTAEFTKASGIGFSPLKTKRKRADLKEAFENIKEKVLKELKHKIKPEILNRLDHIIVFNTLSQNEIKKIVNLELKKLQKRLAKKFIILNYPRQVIAFLAQKSNSGNQGARFVQKNIRDLVENKIAETINQTQKNTSENATYKIYLNIKNDKLTANRKNK